MIDDQNFSPLDWACPQWQAPTRRTDRIDALVPGGFEAYLRILHRPGNSGSPGSSWAQVAQRRGLVLDARSTWAQVSAPATPIPAAPPIAAPPRGHLDADSLVALSGVLGASTTGPFVAAFWTGWDSLREDSRAAKAVRKGRQTRIGDQDFLLYSFTQVDIGTALWMDSPGFGWGTGRGTSPGYLWPADHLWCLVTDVDADSTVLGGSAALIAEVERVAALECLRLKPETEAGVSLRRA